MKTAVALIFRQVLITTILPLLITHQAFANPNTFEVRAVNIGGTNAGTGFITITFDAPFIVTPLVFTLGATNGGHACDARVTNVTLTSFDVACVESSNYNGPHTGMAIQYLAITPGVHAIPTSGGGTVTFEAGSISTTTQQYNYVCPPGDAVTDCVTEGFDTVTPATSFSATPVILGQVQTSVNESATPPGTTSQPFLTTAFDIDESNATSFGLAIERNEDIAGAVTMNETVAWLAVERTTACETLDFSALGGPSAVNFQAFATDEFDNGTAGDTDGFDALDGWTNGCNANEGASFAAGCFTTAPVVLANKRSRNESDGGWLRQCTINTSEVRLTIDEDRGSDTERAHADESASILAFGPAFSTPVTLSNISVSTTQKTADFSWQTATETFNIGFNLWGEFNNKWIRLNKHMIPSLARDKLTPSNYSQTVRFKDKHRGQIVKFGISSLDVSGKEEFFGPFLEGQSYGEQAIPEPIDWQIVRADYIQRMQDRGYVFNDGRWLKPKVKGGSNDHDQWLNISTPKQGIYSLSFADIVSQGLDWNGVPINKIALTFKGQAIPRHIVSEDRFFNDGDHIEFLALSPQGHDALYLEELTYQLQVDKHRALDMTTIEHSLDFATNESETSNRQLIAQRLGNQTFYTELSPNDPWMDTELFSYGSPAEKVYSFAVSDDLIADSEGKLRLSLAGGIDYPGVTPDHHLQVLVNEQVVFDGVEDGFVDWQLNISLVDGILKTGLNTIKLILPADTGYPVDIVNVDFIELGAYAPLVWSVNNNQATQFAAQTGMKAYQVSVDTHPGELSAYIFDHTGNVSRVTDLSKRAQANSNSLTLPALAMQDKIGGVTYWLGSRAQMLQASNLSKSSAKKMLSEQADYLVIAHPSFIGEDLDAYVEYKQSTGLSTRVVDLSDIIEQFGFAMNTPEAVRNYLLAANHSAPFQYILLVGGHSYDYLDHLNQGSVSFIPTWYRPVDLIQYGPTDTPFVQLTADGKPDKAIGRWPVRTLTDLQHIIRKTIEWDVNQMSVEQSALLIAEQKEGNMNFALQLDAAMQATVNKWNDVTQIYLDDVFAQQPAGTIADARQSIIDRINQGVGLTVFNGHGSPSSWTFQSLMNWQHLQTMENHGKPTMIMPLACYTTYYETPSVNSLAHQWLFYSNSTESQGAVAIHGAMVLGEYRENAKFADSLLKRQLKQGKTLGEGILAVKRSLSPWNQMVNNWALLGDPTLRMGQ
ncbi:MAG: C25 family cysteine peptidase [Arenicella sp.]